MQPILAEPEPDACRAAARLFAGNSPPAKSPPDNPPAGNHFPSSDRLHDLFGQAGLEAVDVADSPTSPARRRTGRTGSKPWSANCTAGTGTGPS